MFFFFKQKTAYEMRISDWSSDVCSSDLLSRLQLCLAAAGAQPRRRRRRARRAAADLSLPRARLSHPAAEPSRLFLSAGRACCGSHRAAAGRPQHSSTRATTREDRRMKDMRSEEHTSELQSLMRISYAVFCLKKKITPTYTYK